MLPVLTTFLIHLTLLATLITYYYVDYIVLR